MPTAGDLRTELRGRGFQDTTLLSDARALTFINDAVTFLNEGGDVVPGARWIWLETSTTGTAPLTVSDVREVLYVDDTTNDNSLAWADIEDVRQWAGTDLAQTGSPTYWYWSSETQISVWPANTSVSLAVRYLKVPATLAAGDTPGIPARYHSLITDMAEVFALRQVRNFEAANQRQADVNQALNRLAGTMLVRNRDNADVVPGSGYDW
jgi:hypothetical protein